MRGMELTDRTVLRLSGGDVRSFLQNLVTNDVDIGAGEIVYAALLTPQGKYLSDFFISRDGEAWALDVDAAQAQGLVQRLSMYKLRADVAIAADPRSVWRLWDTDMGLADPRHEALGRLYYSAAAPEYTPVDAGHWDALRVAHLIPQAGQELQVDDSYILEMAFERLNGVDFRKGCYVGQEVTARMKHKTSLRKGLARVAIDGSAAAGDAITLGGKSVGVLHTIAGDQGIAYLRFDRAGAGMQAGEAAITRIE